MAKKDCDLRGVTTLLGDEPHLGRLIAELRAGRSRRVYGLPSSAHAVTTAALVLCFLLADLIGPWLLVRIICLLSKLRVAATFLTRKVHV